MGLFGGRAARSIALIDIASGSVGGAYLHVKKDGTRIMPYSVRVPITVQGAESLTAAMLRALAEADSKLIKEGSPHLFRAAGSGRAESVLVSVGSPWQETAVRIERIEEPKPFTFTRTLMNEVIARTSVARTGRATVREAVIATLLNGYDIRDPFGKKVKLADIVILSSTIEESVEQAVRQALRATYRPHEIAFEAFAPVAYSVFRDVYPHEKNFIVLDAGSDSTDAAFVEHGFLVSVLSAPFGTNSLLKSRGSHLPLSTDIAKAGEGVRVIRHTGEKQKEAALPARDEWIRGMLGVFKAFSEGHPLPRTVFLIAPETVREYLRAALDDASLRSLWLSDEPLSIMPVTASHFSSLLTLGEGAEPDAPLMMLAVFHGKRGT